MPKKRRINPEFEDDGEKIPAQDRPEDFVEISESPIVALDRLKAEGKITADEHEILISILNIQLTLQTSEAELLKFNELLKVFHKISASTPDLPAAVTAPIYKLADIIERKANSLKKGKLKEPPRYSSEIAPKAQPNHRDNYVSSPPGGVDYNKYYKVSNGAIVQDGGRQYLIMNGRRTPLKS